MRPRIQIDRIPEGSIAVVVVEGEHDLASRDKLLAAFDRACSDAPNVVIDLSDATFIDSSILSVLAEANWTPSRSLWVIAPRPETPAGRLLDVTDTRARLSIVPSIDAAAG